MKIVICVLLCLAVGGLSGYATSSEIKDWYLLLQKPSWNPPNYLFGPVWTTLYAMMGVSMALVWDMPVANTQKQTAMLVFGLQLFLNFMWSFVFFKWHQMGWALVEILLLWCAILFTILLFYKIHKIAAFLLVPYLCWVSFATFLNLTIWKLN
jgi:tryptophan-rich sensory protein